MMKRWMLVVLVPLVANARSDASWPREEWTTCAAVDAPRLGAPADGGTRIVLAPANHRFSGQPAGGMSVSAFLHYDGVPPGDYRESDLLMRYGMGDWSAFDSGGSPPRPPSTEWEFIGDVTGDGRPMEGELAIHIAWAHEIPGFTLRRVCATMSYLRRPDVPPPPPAEADEEAACSAAPGRRPGWGHLGLLLLPVLLRRRRP